VPFFSDLPFPRTARYGISFGQTESSFDANRLLPSNYWTTTAGIVAVTVTFAGALLLVVAAFAIGILCMGRKEHGSSAKEKIQKLDVLFSRDHKNGPAPAAMVERKTAFGSFMGLVSLLMIAALATFLVLNWYYNPTLSSQVIPFGYAGEEDPSAEISAQFIFWGWSGSCTCNGANQFDFSGLGLNSSSWRISCQQTQFSCAIDISATSVVIGTVGTFALEMPTGNSMGISYSLTVSPSLNESSTQYVSETIWAGQEEVFGGATSTQIPISMTWGRVADEQTGYSNRGWVVAAAGTTPGSILNNATYASTIDKTVRLRMLFSRGTTFLSIRVTYSTSIAILVGAILGYLGSVIAACRVTMRVVESWHNRSNRTPPSVSAYLSQLGSKPSLEAHRSINDGSKFDSIEMMLHPKTSEIVDDLGKKSTVVL
jgi:hypothetical protein